MNKLFFDFFLLSVREVNCFQCEVLTHYLEPLNYYIPICLLFRNLETQNKQQSFWHACLVLIEVKVKKIKLNSFVNI